MIFETYFYYRLEGYTTFIAPDNVNISENVDWRSKGAVTPVKDQGQCGSCWAFAATGALESQHFRKTGKLVSLSEQNLIDCTSAYGCGGCNGGYIHKSFLYIRDNNGIDSEDYYTYLARQTSCHFERAYVAATDSGYALLTQGSEAELLKAVASIGPIAVAIHVSDSFTYYHSGVYYDQFCDRQALNHGVLVVGYGTDSKGGDYWLVKNSWSMSWGDQGYIKMARNRNNNCGIGMLSLYPTV